MEEDNILRDFNEKAIHLKDRIIIPWGHQLFEGRVAALDYSEKIVTVKLNNKIAPITISPKQVIVIYNLDEGHEWESLYYKENSIVGLLRTEIKSLKSQIDYLNSKIAYIQKYREEI